MEGTSTAPSSSSNHVVLERLNGSKSDKKIEAGDLPSLGEDDIHNVIGSCKYFRSPSPDRVSRRQIDPVTVGYLNESLHGGGGGQDRRDDGGAGGGGKQGWMMSDSGYNHNQITAHRTHAFTTGQSYSSSNGEYLFCFNLKVSMSLFRRPNQSYVRVLRVQSLLL